MTEEEKQAHAKRIMLEWLSTGPPYSWVGEDEQMQGDPEAREEVWNEMLRISEEVAERLV